MAYVPAYKIGNYPGQGQGSAGASPEGINAFLSRIKRAQVDADRAEDLRIQEQVASGTISIDDQIKYNEKRQARFLPSTEEFQQLQNNIADLNVAKKWQVQSTMDADGKPKADQISYLKAWHSTLTPGGELANKIGDKIGELMVLANRDRYSNEYGDQVAKFNSGKAQRQAVVSYLEGQLAATDDEALKASIQADLNTQKQGLLDDAERMGNAAVSAFERQGNPETEGTYLGLLEDSMSKDQAAGDAANVAVRQGDIDSQKRYLVGVTLDAQLKAAQYSIFKNPMDLAGDEKYLEALRAVQGKEEGDFTYTGTDGSTKKFHMADLQNMTMNSGSFSGSTLRTGVTKELTDFITGQGGYIDDKVADVNTKFSKLQENKGANYDSLLKEATTIKSDWDKFKSKDVLQGFQTRMSVEDSSVQTKLRDGLISALGNKFSSGELQDEETLKRIEDVQSMFPTISGIDFQEKQVIPLQQQIAGQNLGKFVQETTGKFSDKLSQVGAARTKLNSDLSILGTQLSAGTLDQPTYASRAAGLNQQLQQLNGVERQYSDSQTRFNNQYTGSAGDSYAKYNYKNFLPGKFGKPKPIVNIPNVPDFVNKLAPAVSTAPKVPSAPGVKIKVSDPKYLKFYQESELDRSSGGIYLKPGVNKRW